MLSRFFGEVEKWKVEVVKSFEDRDIDMGGETWITPVPVGAIGIATKRDNGNVTVVFDNVRDAHYNDRVKVFFHVDEEMNNNFKWVEQIIKPKKGDVKKSSIFGK